MNLKKYNETKIFITGINGAGKTTFALKYSELYNIPYINFDANWLYSRRDYIKQYYDLIELYPNVFITDAIPYTISNGNFLFEEYYKENANDIKTVCCFCSNITEHERRITGKVNDGHFKMPSNLFENYSFYYNVLKHVYSKFNTEYYDSFTNEFVSQNELYERIDWVRDLI
jgi:hypothetical protein